MSPAVSSSDSTFSYINVPSNASPNIFSSPSFELWPYTSGITPAQVPALHTDSSIWQTPQVQEPQILDVYSSVNSNQSFQPYVVPQANTPQARSGSTPNSRLGYTLGIQSAKRNMQDYPSPQLSDPGQIDPSYAPFQPKVMASPGGISLIRSPSISGSSSSPRAFDVTRGAPRNHVGLLVCDHPNCSEGNPAFARRCEWA